MQTVSPACAGMILPDADDVVLASGEPRMRGDDPGFLSTRVRVRK